MLILVQFPLIDLRSFLTTATGRLSKPAFPVLDPPTGRGRDWFVRGSGAIRQRLSRDDDQLASEDFYCDASGLVRFKSRPLAGHALRQRATPYLAFRRLFWDGRLDEGADGPPRAASLVGRVDVGIGLKPSGRLADLALDEAEIDAVLHAVLSEKIRGTWKPDGTSTADELAFIGPALATTVLRATTSAEMRGQAIANPWWIQAGRPSVIVEFDRNNDAKALPSRAKALSLPQLWDECGVRVHFSTFNHLGAPMPVWFVGHSFEHHRRDVRGRLRRCLTRMNAEIAALQSLGRMVTEVRFQAEIDRPDATYFRHFVTSSLQQIQADRRAGMAQLVMTDLVLAAKEAAAPGEFANLRRIYESLDKRGQHLADRFLNRVTAAATQAPLSYRHDFFLAHSSQDAALTDVLREGLTARGAGVYVDNRSLQPGGLWPDQLLAAQKASKVTIALVSVHSVKSLWFKSECITALNLLNSGLAHALVPLLLDTSEIPYGVNIVQGIRLLQGVTADVLDRLMKALTDVSAAAGRT